MMNPISFQQHILTSSKARRGFRTYQYTVPMDEATDEKLGSYGVYSPTAYPNIASLQPSDYPELFMFYSLDNHRKVLSRSVYIGLDLHSYPPRSGNYISHALVYDGNDPINPVEIYEKARWKTPQEVADEDGGSVAETIGPLSVSVEPDFYDGEFFLDLMGGRNQASQSAEEQVDCQTRQAMFRAIVYGIVTQQKVMIIDRKEMLLKWTLSLLQAFPAPFVYTQVTITSLVNTDLPTNLCRVLCCEKMNAERVKRYHPQAVIIDFDHAVDDSASLYANVLIKFSKGPRFNEFRKKIFTSITAAGDYSPKAFNTHALFYEKIEQVSDMSPETFKEFLRHFIELPEYIDGIFQEVEKHESIEKCQIIWHELWNHKNSAVSNLQKYKTILKYRISNFTNPSWIDFERMVASQLSFTTLDEVIQFYEITPFKDPKRHALYYERIVDVVRHKGNYNNYDIIEEGINLIRNEISILSSSQEKELAQLENYAKVLDKVNKGDLGSYLCFIDNYPSLDSGQLNILRSILPPFNWTYFFALLSSDPVKLNTAYAQKIIVDESINSELANCIVKENYRQDPGRFYQLYRQLPLSQKTLFDTSSTNELKEILYSKYRIDSVDKLEESIHMFLSTIPIADILQKFQNDVSQKSEYTAFWKLCDLILNPSAKAGLAGLYPSIIGNIKETDLTSIYMLLNEAKLAIPSSYTSLAELLYEKKYINRPYQNQPKNIELIREPLLISQGYIYVLKTINLPWTYVQWGDFWAQLSEEDRTILPQVLKEVIDYVGRRSTYSPAEYGYGYSLPQWMTIICHYYVFLILQNKEKDFKQLSEQISITWDDHGFIKRTISVLIHEPNELYTLFEAVNRAFFNRSGPRW